MSKGEGRFVFLLTQPNCNMPLPSTLEGKVNYYTSTSSRRPDRRLKAVLNWDGPSAQPFRPPKPIQRGLYAARVYPNNEFTLGYVKKQEKLKADRDYENGRVDGHYGTSPGPDEVETSLGRLLVPHSERLYDPLNLAIVRNCHTVTKTYGLHGITSYGKRMVRNIGFCMERDYGKKGISMGTLTIPQFTEKLMKHICSHWGYLVRAFFQEMKRTYEREGLRFRYCSVTEIQPKRWANSKQVGLHIHFLWCPVWVDWASCYLVSYDEIRALWRRLLQNVVTSSFINGGQVPSVPNPNFRNEVVKKSACAYMAKYLSKGSDIISAVASEKGEEYLPKQWWSADVFSKKQVCSEIVELPHEDADILLQACHDDNADIVMWSFPIMAVFDGGAEGVVGYCGYLTPTGATLARPNARVGVPP